MFTFLLDFPYGQCYGIKRFKRLVTITVTALDGAVWVLAVGKLIAPGVAWKDSPVSQRHISSNGQRGVLILGCGLGGR